MHHAAADEPVESSWQDYANCLGVDPDLFFPERGASTREAKEVAFDAAVETDDLPNALLGATVGGYAQPDHRELQRGFIDRYFAALPEVWTTRTNETAQTIVLGLYPGTLVEQATLDVTDRFLARDDIPAGARRLVNEGRDGVERSLRCQARDS